MEKLTISAGQNLLQGDVAKSVHYPVLRVLAWVSSFGLAGFVCGAASGILRRGSWAWATALFGSLVVLGVTTLWWAFSWKNLPLAEALIRAADRKWMTAALVLPASALVGVAAVQLARDSLRKRKRMR